MFRIDWVEKYFSRVRPWHILAVWVPIGLVFLWKALHAPGASLPLIAPFLLLGVLFWTFAEYVLHRFVFHFKPSERSELQQDVAYIIHGVHHDYPWDADRLVMPPVPGLLIGAVLWWVVSAVFGPYASATFAGTIAGYIWYDLTHYFTHHGRPKSRYGKWLRKYHMLHHFASTNNRFGITTPLWDVVFRTYPNDQYSGAAAQEPAEAEH